MCAAANGEQRDVPAAEHVLVAEDQADQQRADQIAQCQRQHAQHRQPSAEPDEHAAQRRPVPGVQHAGEHRQQRGLQGHHEEQRDPGERERREELPGAGDLELVLRERRDEHRRPVEQRSRAQ